MAVADEGVDGASPAGHLSAHHRHFIIVVAVVAVAVGVVAVAGMP